MAPKKILILVSLLAVFLFAVPADMAAQELTAEEEQLAKELHEEQEREALRVSFDCFPGQPSIDCNLGVYGDRGCLSGFHRGDSQAKRLVDGRKTVSCRKNVDA